jgi:hypothetical protein
MDISQKETELEEGEINDLEDGEIEDDETPENPVKTPLISKVPQSNIHSSSDFPRFEKTNTANFRGGNFSYFNTQRPKPPRRRDGVPPSRFIEEESRFRERESPQSRMRVRPSFHHDNSNVNSPRQANIPWKKGIPRSILKEIQLFINVKGADSITLYKVEKNYNT